MVPQPESGMADVEQFEAQTEMSPRPCAETAATNAKTAARVKRMLCVKRWRRRVS